MHHPDVFRPTRFPESTHRRLREQVADTQSEKIVAAAEAISGAIGAGGLYSLISASALMGNERTIFTVLGWTFFGIGALLAVVGIPLLVVGIVRVSSRPGELSLSLDELGSLAVRF